MSDVNSVKKLNSADFSVATTLSRKPRRPAIAEPGRQATAFMLLNSLHQELKGINEGIIRTNTALVELVDEMRSLRMS